MKRVFFTLLSLFLFCFTISQAQIVTLVDENFENPLSGWTIIPFASWEADTNLYAGGHTAYRAYVPTGNQGDTTVLLSPIFDFSTYGYAFLTFDHICKVSADDICRIEYRENSMSSSWKPLPTSSYKGEGNYINTSFNHNTYSDWQSDDLLATPNQSWWKTETFDISDEVSFAQVQFRFIITKGSVLGTQFAYGWVVDNFHLTASVNPIAPPVVEFITNYDDTVFFTGPFELKAKVASRTYAPILIPKLYYSTTFNSITTNDSVTMTAVEGDSIWTATIPQYVFGTSIAYYIIGYDSVGNTNSANSGFYVKRGTGGNTTGYIYLGDTTSGSGNTSIFFNTNAEYSWSRNLFYSSELNNTDMGLYISKIAVWSNSSVMHTRTNQKMYMMAVDSMALSYNNYIDPSTIGATLVWSGGITTQLYWNEYNLHKPFYLPPGKNLIMYFVDETGTASSSTTSWVRYVTPNYTNAYGFGTSLSNTSTNLRDTRIVVRFGFGASVFDDSNSVALHTIDYPTKNVISGQLTPIVATIKNRGFAELDSCIINYSINGVSQTPMYWKGNLSDDFNATDTIGYYIPRLNDYDTIVVWVSMPNGELDSITNDDSLQTITYGCAGFLSGNYVVGPNSEADFANLNDFFTVLNLCGVSGNIKLQWQDGIYTENWDLSDLNKLMGGFTLTITSLSGNPDNVILRPLSNAGIILNNTENLIIEGITIDAATNAYYAIQFTGACQNVVISNNKLYANSNTSSSSYAVIYQEQNTGLLDNIKIVNNYIDGGYYGIYLYGIGQGIANYNTHIYIDSNEITNAYYYASYFYYTSLISISYNDISTGTTIKSGNFFGIRTYYCDVEKLCNNLIYTNVTMTSSIYGIYSYYLNVSTTGLINALYANNEIRLNGTSITYGMRLYYTNVDVIHNSIYANSTSTTYAIYNYGGSTDYIHNIKNNIFICTYSSSYPIYITDLIALLGWTLDYNNYYAPMYVGYCGAAYNTISSWQAATLMDQHSVSFLPNFYDVNSNLVLIKALGLQCPIDSSAMIDIKGKMRTFNTNMGCYHFEANTYDVFPIEVISPLRTSSTGISIPLTVAVHNIGIDTITSMSIGWELNGVVQTPYLWTGSVAQYDTVHITLGNFIPQVKANNLKVFTYNPNSQTDQDVNNDTIITHTFGCNEVLSGNYSVGSVSADFADLQEVTDALQYCGISDSVMFLIDSGHYESMNINSLIPGISKTNIVTFTSANGKTDDVVIGSGGVALTLTDAEHLIFKNLTFGDTTDNTNYGIQFIGMCNNIEINACNIYSSVTATSSSYVPVYCNNQNQSKYLKNVRILNNNIRGGYCNIYMYYLCGNSSSNMLSGFVIINGNVLTDAYNYGIYNYYHGRYYSISNNTIISRSNAGSYYAIYSEYYTTIDTVCNNKIQITSTGNSYGMYFYRYQNNSTSYGAQGPMFIANNEIIISSGNQAYGIYDNSGSSYSRYDIYHNSIYISNKSNAYGFYLYPYNSSYKYNYLNNNVYLNTTSSSAYMMYFGSTSYMTTSYCTFDYNNYFKPSGTKYYGSTSYKSLSSWQSGKSQDKQSTEIDPVYADPLLALIPTKDTVGLLCPVLNYVPYDLMEAPRLSSNNNKGCYTVIYNLDVGIYAIMEPTNYVIAGNANPVKVKLKNYGKTTLTSVVLNWEIEGVTQTPVSLTDLSLPLFADTVIDLGDFIPSVSKTILTLKVWTSYPDSATDNFVYNDTAYAFPYVCDSALNGIYTIGLGGNYQDINEALQNITICGISGPVTLAFLSGTYSSISINGIIPGTNVNNKITFTSASGKASDVVIGSSGTALLLNQTSNLNFKNLTIGFTSSTTTYGVEMKGMCENILFYGCDINTDIAATKNTIIAVRYENANGSPDYLKNVHFIKNNINGGYYNLYFRYPAGSSANMSSNAMSVVIDSNTFTNSYYYGIYSYYYARYSSISYNTITSRNTGSLSSTWYGIYIYNYHNVDEMVGNKIKSTNTSLSNAYGILIYGYYNSTNYSGSGAGIIANNEISLQAGNQESGISIDNTYANPQIVHNSVYLSGNAIAKGLNASNSNAAYRPVIKNNIFVTAANVSSYPVYYNDSYYDKTYYDVDYNNYYSTGSFVAFAHNAIPSLTLLRNLTQQDNHSRNDNPNFVNPNVDLHTLNQTTGVIPLITNDINNQSRSTLTTMGCYHDYIPIPVDVKIEALLSPSDPKITPYTQIPISVLLTNFGTDTITSCQIEWRINNVAQNTYYWTGSLAYLDTISVQIGTYMFPSRLSTLKVNTALPNNQTDNNTFNDTIGMTVCMCDSALSGIYTVGGAGSDFADLDEAMFVLTTCGVSDDVEFQLNAGTYEAVYIIKSIEGTNDTTNITFTSTNGNPGSVVIRNASGGTALTLINAKNLRFKNITIGTTTNSTTCGIKLAGKCEGILFYECNIYSSITTTNSEYAAVYFYGYGDNTNNLTDVRFIKNNISGGYYNMHFYHSGGSISQSVGGSTTIDSNTFSNAYYYGIYAYGIWYFPSISHNKISNRTSGNTGFYGIYLLYYNTVDSLIGNKIHISNTNASTYGIYVDQYINTKEWGTGGALFAANNEIIIENASGSTYGIYTGKSSSKNMRADFLFNSIYISGSSDSYGLYRGYCSSSYQIAFQYNNVYITNPSAEVFPVYVHSDYPDATYGLFDYNNYYRIGGGTTYYGLDKYTSLSTWQNAYNHDLNSVIVSPSFIDPTQSLELTDYSKLLCPNIGVLTDIKGELRSSYTTIGCYTIFIYNGKNIGLVALLEPVNTDKIDCYQDFANVSLVFANRGNVETEFYTTPVIFKLRVSGAVNYQKDTILTFGKMIPTTRDTFTLTNFLPVSLSGSYNINLWLEMQGDSYPLDDTLKRVFVVDKANIPYATNFDSIPNRIVIDQLLGSSTWSVESGTGVNPSVTPVYGTGRLQFASASGLGSIARLTFQPFNLQGTVMPQCKLWYAHDNANASKKDYTDVKISVDGGITFTPILHLQRYNTAYTSPAFARYEVDLSPYAKYSCVILALEAGSYGGGNQNIDSIVIISKQDISMALNIPNQSNLIACDLDNQSIFAHLSNNTSQSFDFNKYPSQINLIISGAVDTMLTIPLTSGTINGDTTLSYDLIHGFDFSKNGYYHFMAYIDAADDNYKNDTVREIRIIHVDAQLIKIDSIEIKEIGDTVYPRIHMKNIGSIPINGLNAHVYINNVKVISEKIDNIINLGDTLSYTFTSPFIVPVATKQQPYYHLKIQLELPCDGAQANNSIARFNDVNVPSTVDLSITEIYYPIADSCETGFKKVYPRIEVFNAGYVTAVGAKLHIKVDSAGVQIDSLTESLNDVEAKESINYVSITPYRVPNFNGNYTVYFKLELDDDADISNNQASVQTCAKEFVSVSDIDAINWSMGQNIPNPAKGITQIPYTVPQDGNITFKVITIKGQTLYIDNLSVTAGNNMLEFEISNLSNGIYYYSMEYQGQRMIKKLTVQK